MRRATNSLTLSVGRSAFRLTEQEEQCAIRFAVDLRRIVRRAASANCSPVDVVEAFERALSDWPADRAAAVLHAVDALVRLPPPRPAMTCVIGSLAAIGPAAIPALTDGDGLDYSGDAA